jgi:Flp pilus assembly protein TadD
VPRFTYTILACFALVAATWLTLGRGASPLLRSDPAQHATISEDDTDAIAHRGWTTAAPAAASAGSVDVAVLAASLVEQGRAALADGDLKAGFEAYRRAVEYNPTAETHGLVGDLYLRMAVRSEAAFHLRRAAELDSENPDRWIALANAYYLATDPMAAAKALDRAKQLDPTIVIERDDNNFVVRGQTGSPERDS